MYVCMYVKLLYYIMYSSCVYVCIICMYTIYISIFDACMYVCMYDRRRVCVRHCACVSCIRSLKMMLCRMYYEWKMLKAAYSG